MLVVGHAGELPGEVAGVGAHRYPPGPGRGGQACQGAAQQIRRGRPRVIGAVAQVGGQHDLGLGPGRHVRAADPLALVVIGHAALLAAVDLHIGGVQVDRHRAAGQRRRPPAGSKPSIRSVTAARPDSTARHWAGREPAGQPRRGGRRQARHRRERLARRIGALPVQPGQEILPGQLRRRDPDQQLTGPEPPVALLDRADRRIQFVDHAEPVHNSVTAARPAFAVSDASGAPARTR